VDREANEKEREKGLGSISAQEKLEILRGQLMTIDKKELVEVILRMSDLMTGIVREKKIVSVPISLFRSTELSAYELITTYLKESLGMTLTQIAKATGRNPQAVYITLRNAREKLKNPLSLEYSENDIPLKIIADRDFSILECIVAYLVEKKGLSLAEISKLLYRDNRTIWTIYDRFKKKREKL
jgi:DNA-binding CsgD family transcriptional regulator